MSSVAMSSPPSVVSIDDLSASDVGSVSAATSDGEHPSRVPTPSRGVDALPRHPRFYFEDGSLTLLIDGMLFDVHRSVFASLSPFWARELQSEPPNPDKVYHFDGVYSEEMASFLNLIYPRIFSKHEVDTVSGWRAVLKVADMWKFDTVRELAVQQLDGLVQPLERLVLARAYDLTGWLERAFVDCILRESLPSSQEMDDLDLKLVDYARIATAREDIARGRLSADPQSVRLHVQRNMLFSEPAPSVDERDTVHEPSVKEPPPTQSAPILPHDQHPTSPSAQDPSQVALSPTSPSPSTVPPTFTYVPVSVEEGNKIRTWVSHGSFEPAFETITSRNVIAFCERLTACSIWKYKDELLTALSARVARFPDFHHVAVYIGRYALKMFKTTFENRGYMRRAAFLQSQLSEVVATSSDDEILLTLKWLPSDNSDNPKINLLGCIGPKEFLTYHPGIFRQRSERLAAFLTAALL